MKDSNNHFENAGDVAEYIVIPKAEYTITLSSQERASLQIRNKFGVLSAIDFNDQSCRVAGEVGEVRTYGGLASEMNVGQTTKPLPKFVFGIGRIGAH